VQRVAILGNGGAGKSELAREISRRAGLPVVHLDVLYWRDDWTPGPREEFLRDLAAATAGERWIIDGNFLSAEPAAPRFDRVDTVIFIDLPRATCLRRALWRFVRDRRRRRPDLPGGCREGFDLTFLRWIWRYARDDRPQVLRMLGSLDGSVAVHHLRSPAEVKRYLAAL
jgi:adenylate kinase family enzyme